MRVRSAILLLTAATGWVACRSALTPEVGGPTPTPTSTPIPGRPQVVAIWPTSGAMEVSVRGPWLVEFSEPIDASSLAGGIRLEVGPNDYAVEPFALSPTVFSLRPDPASTFATPAAGQLVLTTAIEDSQGEALDAEATAGWRFPEWYYYPIPAGAGGTAEEPALAIDSAGLPVLGWTELNSVGAGKEIFVSRLDRTGEWEPVVSAFRESLSVDAKNVSLSARPGEVVFAWEEDGSLRMKRVTDGALGSTQLFDGPLSTGPAAHPSITHAPGGVLLLAWDQHSTVQSSLSAYGARCVGTVCQNAPIPDSYSEPDTDMTDPAVGVLGTNTPCVAAVEASASGSSFVFVHCLGLASYGPLNSLAGPVNPALAGNDGPILALAYVGDGAKTEAFRYSSSVNLWTAVESPSEGTAGATGLSLQVASNGELFAAWTGVVASDPGVVYVRRMPLVSTIWQVMGTLETDLSAFAGTTPASDPDLVLDGFGFPVIAWIEPDLLDVPRVVVVRLNR